MVIQVEVTREVFDAAFSQIPATHRYMSREVAAAGMSNVAYGDDEHGMIGLMLVCKN